MCLASCIAALAARSSASGSRPCAGCSATPIETSRKKSCPGSATGCASSSRTACATWWAMCSLSCAGASRANSSSPRRMVSARPCSAFARLAASARSTSSPTEWPCASLKSLKRSTSSSSRAKPSPAAHMSRSLASSALRLGRPVSSSWVAWCSIAAVASCCAVSSLTTTCSAASPSQSTRQAEKRSRIGVPSKRKRSPDQSSRCSSPDSSWRWRARPMARSASGMVASRHSVRTSSSEFSP